MTTNNPTLSEVLKTAADAVIKDLHTAMPGIVQAYDPATQLADVQPALKRTFADGTTVSLPLLSKIPVLFPRSAIGFVHIPLQVGDSCLLIFCERSIDLWRSLGITVDPAEGRTHDLSDAVVIPGLFSNLLPIPNTTLNGTDVTVGNGLSSVTLKPTGDVTVQAGPTNSIAMTKTGDILLSNALGSIELTPTGKFKITGAAGALELLTFIDTLITTITQITTATSIGTQPILNIPAFVALKTQLAAIRG